MDDRYIAYILFKEGVSGQEIARIMKRSEQTISRWKRDGDWEQKATEDLMAMQTIHEDIRDLVRYQLVQLRKLKDQYIKAETDGGDPKLISKGDIDGVRDLYNMIKEKETDWTTLVRTVRKINKYLKDNHPELAREVAPALNDFLNEERGGAA
jgi:type I site-specific restriction endonuclease